MKAYDFGMLPFVYAPLKKPSNEELPDFMPFALEIDEITGLIVQSPNPEVKNVLNRAYVKGSVFSGMMDNAGIGQQYAEDFLRYLKRQSGRNNFSGCRFLDIGCGMGYLLHRIQKLGGLVIGLEPGAHGQSGSAKFGVPIIRDFFPSNKVKGRFDFILGFGLLEHLNGLGEFFSAARAQLKDNGFMIFAVPDCEPYLQTGDISFLLHEHWSYFTANTLRTTIQKYTGMKATVDKGGFGGTIYSASRHDKTNKIVFKLDLAKRIEEFNRFIAKSNSTAEGVTKYLQTAQNNNQTVGIYVPGRAVNILATIKEMIPLNGLRFFDDNNSLHGTFLPGFDMPIESRNDLLNRPTDKVIIMSRTFGNKIAGELRNAQLKSELTLWGEVLDLL
jgi:SAM-dependent methyltransferase